ncbi:unnamed protein product [Urochloa humidicola]
MKQAATVLRLPAGMSLSINDKLAIKVAEQLGLLDQEYSRLKAEGDERWYYSYGLEGASYSPANVRRSTVPQINQKLTGKKYLLVVENLYHPIKPIQLEAFTEDLLCLPPPQWKDSFWLVSATSQDVYEKSKPSDYPCLIALSSGDDIVMLTLCSLHQAAMHILGVIGHKDEQYWHHVTIRCFHYAAMLCSSACEAGDQQNSNALIDITPDELIRQWAAQGIITVIQERTGEVTSASCRGEYNDIHKVGNVILEAFREYSLLHIPFSLATKTDEATKSAAHFLACYNLIAEGHTIDDKLFEGNLPGLKRMQWISHVGEQGWHVRRDLLSQGSSGPVTLIVRHCSQQSRLFVKLESDHHFLAYLRVLDLSYTALESLPPSICYLQKLQLLSLRGCYNLKSPFSFPDTEITVCQNNGSKKLISLLYLDLSYSNINTFQGDFFHNMPNLKELLLAKCSNLEELPPSTPALLSSLTKIELIDNKKLLSFTGLTEIVLDGHGTLSSFSLVGTPHIKRLSLHGCSKLETVDIKEVDALEELDLSATAIKELPEDIPNLPRLRRLLLMGVPSLRRFPWHKLQRLPGVFCLDHVSDRTSNHSNPQVPQVCTSDSRLFYSFNENTRDLVRRGQNLKSFYVRVTSSKATTRKIQDEENTVETNKLGEALTAYADVNRRYLTGGVSMVSMDDVPPFRETERHVEISAVDRYPNGLKYLLQVTKSISMSDDCHVSYLTDLSYFGELEECMLKRCDQMVHVLNTNVYGVRNLLKNAYVSHLKSLTHFDRSSYYSNYFYALKHLVLENCPRLEGVFPCGCGLPCLETLDILFCYNLKAVFYNYGESPNDYELPRLRRIRLQELPLLEHLHVDDPTLDTPKWEGLHVRGCWSLRRLPRLRQQPANKAVKVSGERAWWNKLRWDGDDHRTRSHRSSYEPRLPPASTSIRERVVIRTYLR